MNERFKWISWNIEHIAGHGIDPEEAEAAVLNPIRGYPRRYKEGYVVWGRSCRERLLQVAFAKEPDGRIFVFHARPLTVNEKRRIKES